MRQSWKRYGGALAALAAERGRAALPAEGALVAILRSERHLSRELRDAMDAMDRLQARKQSGS